MQNQMDGRLWLLSWSPAHTSAPSAPTAGKPTISTVVCQTLGACSLLCMGSWAQHDDC